MCHLAIRPSNRRHTLRLLQLNLQLRICLLQRGIVLGIRHVPRLHRLGVDRLLRGEERRLGLNLLLVRPRVGLRLLVRLDLVRLGVGGLLLGLARNRRAHHVVGAQPLHLGRCALDFHQPLELLVFRLGRALGFDRGDVDVAAEGGLARRERGFGGGAGERAGLPRQLIFLLHEACFPAWEQQLKCVARWGEWALPFTVSFCLLHRRRGVDLGDLALLLAPAIGLAYVSAQLCRGDVDTCLVGRTFVRLSCQGLKVVAVGGVTELLDVGVVDFQAELVELALDVAEDLALWFCVLVFWLRL